MKRSLKFLAIPVATLATLGVAAGVWAYWATGGTGSANASIGSLAVPTWEAGYPRLGAVAGAVELKWIFPGFPDGPAGADGHFVVTRSRDGGPAVEACGSPVSRDAETCNDTVTQDGNYAYVVKAVFRSWTKESLASAGLQVVIDDTAPEVGAPGATVALPADSYGTNPMYVKDVPVTLTATATDVGTGIAEVNFYYCAASADIGDCASPSGLIGSGVLVPNTDDYRVTWNPPSTDGAYKVIAVAQDGADHSTTSAATQISVDTKPPTVSTPTVNG